MELTIGDFSDQGDRSALERSISAELDENTVIR